MACDEVKHFSSLPHLIFVYGTLKRGQPNHYIMKEFGKHHFLGRGHTEISYPLIIATDSNLPFLLDAPGKGQIVYGEIYCVDDQFLASLDEFEGYPDLYQRNMITIQAISETEKEDNMSVSNSGEEKPQMVKCWVYMRLSFSQSYLEKENFSSYDHFGSHGLRYLPEDDHYDCENAPEGLLGPPAHQGT